jgi:hypothetical protein
VKNTAAFECLCFYLLYACTPNLDAREPVINGVKIPISGNKWYQINNAGSRIDKLFDGILNERVEMVYNRMLLNYDSYYEFRDITDVTINTIRFYDGEGTFADRPLKIYAKRNINAAPVLLATFTGEAYNKWVTINLPAGVKAQYLVMNSWGLFPNEIEFYGNYKKGVPFTKAALKSVPLKNFFGINGFEWDFLEDPKKPGVTNVICEPKLKAMETFTAFRHYMDWKTIEATEGSYSFNPTRLGNWNFDVIYERLKKDGITVLPCLKTLPDWMINTYPADERDNENVPARYGSNLLDPKSYIEQSRAAFQFVARYGYNKNIAADLIKVNTTPRWPNDAVNAIKVGLGYIKYIECENERDKWWKGRKAYQTAFEYAANLSAFYDGNKNTMAPGVGVKNADPGIKVVIGGICTDKDYIRGIIDWCKQYRGYHTDGTVNLCFDVINYHLYNTDVDKEHYGQSGTRGKAPELSIAAENASDFVQMAHDFGSDKEVWVTESGYDINQGSTVKAIAIGDKSPLLVQADWILRTSLMYARLGIKKNFFFLSYDVDAASATQFSSSGLINKDEYYTRKPAADYLYQTNKLFGNFSYQKTVNTNPIIDKYTDGTKVMYMLVIADEVGRKGEYDLNIGSANATVYSPVAGSDDMRVTKITTHNGIVKIPVSETPVFVLN